MALGEVAVGDCERVRHAIDKFREHSAQAGGQEDGFEQHGASGGCLGAESTLSDLRYTEEVEFWSEINVVVRYPA
jgi:hypothetical protein